VGGPKAAGPRAGKPGGRPSGPKPRRERPVEAEVEAKAVAGERSAESEAVEAAAGSGVERLQKILASAGLGSRRACEELILQGRVTVDGEVVRELGTKANPTADIRVDGESIKAEKTLYLAVAKPKGYVSTNDDPAGRPRVVDLVADVPERVYTVGRLDEDSTGLMLLTNDGELANRLAHPRYGVEKVYRATVAGHPEAEALDKLTQGVWLAEGKARAKRVRVVGHRGEATVVEMVLAEGKNREVRRMWAKLGHKVMSLARVAIGPITIKGLKDGQWRALTPDEVSDLKRLAEGKPVPTAWFGPDDPQRRPERPRRGAARHESAGPSGRVERPMGPRADRPARPMGPRGGSGPARPMGPRAGAGPARPMGPRADRPGLSGPPRGPRLGGPVGPAGPRRPRGGSRIAEDGVEEIEVTPGPMPGPGFGGPRGRRVGGPRPGGPRGLRAGGPMPSGPRPGGPRRGPAGGESEPPGRIILGMGRVRDAGEIPPPSRRRRPSGPGTGESPPAGGPPPSLKRRPRPLRARRLRPGGGEGKGSGGGES
jgi:23S rRNA pseudouridine2605 synthase